MRRTIITLLLFMTVIAMNANFSITKMKVCGLTEPLGIDTKPTFSWQTISDKRGFYQGGYSIVVTDEKGTQLWNTGKVASSLQNNIEYEGTELTSRTSYKWTVTVYDKEGNTSSSETSSFETAFMKPSGSDKDGHLSNETAEARQTEVSKTGYNITDTKEWHNLHQTTKLTDVTCMGSPVYHTDKSEEQCCHQTVAEHLDNGTGTTCTGHHQQSEQHKTTMAYG